MKTEQIKKYTELVDHNNYSELLYEVAKDFKLETYIKIFKSLLTIHNTEGYISVDVHTVRTRFKNEMLSQLKNTLTEIEYSTVTKFV